MRLFTTNNQKTETQVIMNLTQRTKHGYLNLLNKLFFFVVVDYTYLFTAMKSAMSIDTKVKILVRGNCSRVARQCLFHGNRQSAFLAQWYLKVVVMRALINKRNSK